jgi:hypothetical protein
LGGRDICSNGGPAPEIPRLLSGADGICDNPGISRSTTPTSPAAWPPPAPTAVAEIGAGPDARSGPRNRGNDDAVGRRRAARLALGAVATAAGAALSTPLFAAVGPVCPLRRLTGIPCPACGSTTALAALATLRPLDALAANPFTVAAVAVGALGVGALAVGGRTGDAAARLRLRARSLPRVAQVVAMAALAVASWTWQLHRFDRW